jgi:SAM-dependent methyltransferase
MEPSKVLRLARGGLLGLALKGELGRWISFAGEFLGSRELVFNPYTFAAFHRSALERAPSFVSEFVRIYLGVRRIVDLGCGSGVFVAEFRKYDVHAEGYEHSATARAIAARSLGIELRPFHVETFCSPKEAFESCICLEVAHYLSEATGMRLVEICTECAPRVAFSSAHRSQGGYGHINEQPKLYWIERFGQLGFAFREDLTERMAAHLRRSLVRGMWFAENICLFERPTYGGDTGEGRPCKER